MLIMVAGPYQSGARTAEERAANLRRMNQAANAVFARGHTPLIGVNMAMPMIDAAGAGSYERTMMPLSLALAERCDAVLRIAGESDGADREVEVIQRNGGQVFRAIDEIPPAYPSR